MRRIALAEWSPTHTEPPPAAIAGTTSSEERSTWIACPTRPRSSTGVTNTPPFELPNSALTTHNRPSPTVIGPPTPEATWIARPGREVSGSMRTTVSPIGYDTQMPPRPTASRLSSLVSTSIIPPSGCRLAAS